MKKELFAMQSKLENGIIKLTSQRKGKELQKVLKLKLVWHQVFPYDLVSFVQSSADTLKIESIALYGPAALSIGAMLAVKLQDEPAVVNGPVKIVFTCESPLPEFLQHCSMLITGFERVMGYSLRGSGSKNQGRNHRLLN